MIPDRQLITAKPYPATNCQTIQVWMLPVACIDVPIPSESSDFLCLCSSTKQACLDLAFTNSSAPHDTRHSLVAYGIWVLGLR